MNENGRKPLLESNRLRVRGKGSQKKKVSLTRSVNSEGLTKSSRDRDNDTKGLA